MKDKGKKSLRLNLNMYMFEMPTHIAFESRTVVERGMKIEYAKVG